MMKQDRRESETYRRIIDAAIAVVFEHGYIGATMARIAANAGVTRGAIQHYFGDRRVDLIAEACEYIIEKRQAAYRETLAVLSEGARSGMKAAYRDPETWFLVEVWIASKGEPELWNRVTDILARVNDPSDSDIQAAITDMGLYRLHFTILKYLLRSLTRGMAIEFSQKPDAALFDSVIDLAFDALSEFAKVKDEAQIAGER
jgi:AcrR family transcriptional regulator